MTGPSRPVGFRVRGSQVLAALSILLLACSEPSAPAGQGTALAEPAEPEPPAPSREEPPPGPPSVWRHATGGEVWSTPVMGGGAVYVGSDDGRLHSLELDTGDVRWSTSLGSPIRSAPAVAGDRVAVSTTGGDVAVVGAEGQILWRRTADAATGVAFDGESVLVVTSEGELIRVDSQGASWRLPLGAPAGPPSWSAGRAVVAGAGGSVHAVDTAEGRTLWRRSLGGGAAARLVGSTVYAVGGSYLWALRAADGAERWRLSASEFLAEPPAVAGDVLLAVAGDGELWAVDAAGGRELWHGRLPGPLRAPPREAGAAVFVGSGDHHFVAFDLASGRAIWRFETDAAMTRALAVGGGRLIFGATDGGVYSVPYELPEEPATTPAVDLEIEVAPSFHEGEPEVVARAELQAPGRHLESTSAGPVLVSTAEQVLAWPACAAAASSKRPLWRAKSTAPPAPLEDGGALIAAGQHLERRSKEGEEVWRVQLGAVAGPPAVEGNLALVGDDAGRVWALALASGEKLWRRQVSGDGPRAVRAAPSASGDAVVASVCGVGLVAFDRRSGREHWRFADLACPLAAPLILGDTVYAVGADGRVVAVDLAVGGERWRLGFRGGGRLTPASHFDMLHVAMDDGSMHAIDLLRGVEAWSAPLGRRPSTPPRVLDGIAYLGSHDGSVYAINALNGDRLWRARFPSEVLGVTALPCRGEAPRLFALTADGVLTALRLP